MAKRFGGKYSPDGQQSAGKRGDTPRAPVAKAADGRVKLLYVPAIILAATSLNDGPITLVTGLVGAAVLTLAAWLLQEGLQAEAAYDCPQSSAPPCPATQNAGLCADGRWRRNRCLYR